MDPIHPIEPGSPIFRPLGALEPLPPLSREERRQQFQSRREAPGDHGPGRDDDEDDAAEPWDGIERRQASRDAPDDDQPPGPHIDIGA